MNKEEILAMPIGRKLDMEIYTKVMGGKINTPPHITVLPNYSEFNDIAFRVVEKMRSTHIYDLADFGRNVHKEKQYYAAFHPINKPRDHKRQVRAKTLAEAICKAALLAAMEL